MTVRNSFALFCAFVFAFTALPEEVRPGVFRTPDERFENLPDYPFEPHYVEVDGKGGKLRVHYVDEGPRDGNVVVFLHGNPTWSYDWRKIIPPTVEAGHRAIAFDMVGLGKSDKPNEMADYSIAKHVEWMRQAMIDELNLRDITLVGHDWGGIIGPRIVALHPNRFSRLVISNSGLASRDPAEPLPDTIPEASGFLGTFQKMVKNNPDWDLWNTVQQFTLAKTPQAVIDAYRAPYPDSSYLHGPRQFTQMLPTRVDNPQLPDNFIAWKTLRRFTGPTLRIFGAKDPVTAASGGRAFDQIPGSAGQPHTVLSNGGHFIQEDDPDGFVAALIPWLTDTESAVPDRTASLTANDIPVAITPNTYAMGMVAPVLEGCDEPLVVGAVDMRGTWKVVECTLNDNPTDQMVGLVQRIEQCGDRVVISTAGVTHDMRCDGTYENGVNDMGEAAAGGRLISVAASFEDGVHILRPKGMAITVEREIVNGDLVWRYLNFSTRSERVETAGAISNKAASLTADDIPVANTPEGGWTEMPAEILAGCTEPIVDGAPDMRGTWKAYDVKVNGKPSQMFMGHIERIEQCGNRVVVSSSGIIHDMRCDDTYENGVHDVQNGMPLTVKSSFKNGVHIIHPKDFMDYTEVTRSFDGDDLIWVVKRKGGWELVARMRRTT